MSEARDDSARVNEWLASRPRLRFAPDARLEESLQRFIRPEDVRTLGRSGLFLYADEAISVPDNQTRRVGRRGGMESPEIASLSRAVRARSLQHRKLANRLQLRPVPAESGGIAIHVDVVLDEMTAGAAMNHMRINPDRSVGAHINIQRQRLVGRQAYLAACKELYAELLDTDRGLGIERIELVQSAPR